MSSNEVNIFFNFIAYSIKLNISPTDYYLSSLSQSLFNTLMDLFIKSLWLKSVCIISWISMKVTSRPKVLNYYLSSKLIVSK